MKTLLKGLGILLTVCAIGIYLIAGYIQEEARPRSISFGAVTNGVYTQTGSGTIGGSTKAVEEMQWLKGIAIMSGIAGVGMIVGSMTVKKEEEPEY